MDSRTQREETLRISRQAAQWLTTLEETGEEQHEAFVAWLKQSSLHVQEFLNVAAIDTYLDCVPADYSLDLAKLRTAAASEQPAVRAFDSSGNDEQLASEGVSGRAHTKSSWKAMLAAAAGVAAVAVAAWFWQASGWQHYTTDTGEQRAIELEDGSLIQLNARSRVDVRLTGTARDVRLLAGEALFAVKKDNERPFKVYAGEAVIQAIGTQFNVYRRESGTTVAVIEGAVRISRASPDSAEPAMPPSPLRAGEEAQVALTGQVTERRSANPERAVAWRQRRLLFDATPLPEIAAEFNRYNRSPQLRIESEAARQRRFTGVFDADDPEALIMLLSRDPSIEVEKAGDEIVVRMR